MSKLVFINLPVADLPRATAFYEAVGAMKNPQFSDETGSCMVISETIHVMLLTEDKFRSFTPKAVANARKTSEVLIALTVDSRDEVDAMIARAEAAGAVVDPGPRQDHGFMYSRSHEDLDGHIWEIFYMDLEAAQAVMGSQETVAVG